MYLDPEYCWQCMSDSSTKDLRSLKEPLLVAIQLDHVLPVPAVALVEALPALA